MLPEPAFMRRERERRSARERARRALFAVLDERQREGVEQGLGFEIVVPSGNHYRIRPGNTVQRLDPSGFPLVTLCVIPKLKNGEWMPEDDHALAQKLLLEADEEEFLRLAIRGR